MRMCIRVTSRFVVLGIGKAAMSFVMAAIRVLGVGSGTVRRNQGGAKNANVARETRRIVHITVMRGTQQIEKIQR